MPTPEPLRIGDEVRWVPDSAFPSATQLWRTECERAGLDPDATTIVTHFPRGNSPSFGVRVLGIEQIWMAERFVRSPDWSTPQATR